MCTSHTGVTPAKMVEEDALKQLEENLQPRNQISHRRSRNRKQRASDTYVLNPQKSHNYAIRSLRAKRKLLQEQELGDMFSYAISRSRTYHIYVKPYSMLLKPPSTHFLYFTQYQENCSVLTFRL